MHRAQGDAQHAQREILGKAFGAPRAEIERRRPRAPDADGREIPTGIVARRRTHLLTR